MGWPQRRGIAPLERAAAAAARAADRDLTPCLLLLPGCLLGVARGAHQLRISNVSAMLPCLQAALQRRCSNAFGGMGRKLRHRWRLDLSHSGLAGESSSMRVTCQEVLDYREH